MPEPGPTGDRVVISQGDEVETLFGGGSEKVNGANARFLIVDRSGSVDMQIRAVPLFGWSGVGFSVSPGRPATPFAPARAVLAR